MTTIAPAEQRRPSDDLKVLKDQILREVARLEREGEAAKEPDLYRVYLRHAESLAWDGVARGDLDAPRKLLDHLRTAQPLADAHRPEITQPLARAAQEVHWLIRSLYVAADTLAERRMEVRLADSCSETEREILKILVESDGEYLRRGDVHERLAPEARPTPARVGQILAELFQDGLLQRVHGRAQGNANASFYALSPQGIGLCKELKLVPAEVAEPPEKVVATSLEPRQEAASAPPPPDAGLAWLQKLVQEALNPKASPTRRGLAVGILANSREPFDRIMEVLESSVRGREEDEATMAVFEQAITQIVLTRSGGPDRVGATRKIAVAPHDDIQHPQGMKPDRESHRPNLVQNQEAPRHRKMDEEERDQPEQIETIPIGSELTFGRCVASLLGRHSAASPPSTAILSARMQAACVASKTWRDRGPGSVRAAQLMVAIRDR